ncbi:hypothetical protein MSPP1_001698 [Malassezia sp. CBS 17886]|nr:hypothetical protein MSPP1_001698 [Malassezia sp. CBS 17886]
MQGFLRRALHLRVPDWFLVVALAVYLRVLSRNLEGFHQAFSLANERLHYPTAAHERVPTSALFTFSALAPAVGIICASCVMKRPFPRLGVGLLGLLLALLLNAAVTNTVKVWIGRPRPDFLSRCRPDMSMAPPTDTGAFQSQLVTDAVCMADHTSVQFQDGFKSFPSGHSSMAFAGLTYLALFMHAALTHCAARLWAYAEEPYVALRAGDEEREETPADSASPRPSTAPPLLLASMALPLLPLMAAVYVASSRVMDYRHHPTDVVAGTILGALIAVSVFRVYHPRGTMDV